MTTGTRTASYTYDSEGNLATITDPLDRVTRFTEYDDLGRVLRVDQADGTVLRYGYDANGNMTLLTTPTPADNSFTYNGINRRSSFLTPLGSSTTYNYNEERQLTKVTLPSGKEIVNSYSDSRLFETRTPEWTNSYTYSCGSLLDTVTREFESISFDYDGSLITNISQSGTLNQAFTFTYNNDFNLTGFSYANSTESYGYDLDGLLTTTGNFTISRNSDNSLPETVFDDDFTLNRSFNGWRGGEHWGVSGSQ